MNSGNPAQPIVRDEHGTIRFKRNAVVRHLLDVAADAKVIDLNRLWVLFHSGLFTVDDMEQFYQQIGYSVCGFCEIDAFRDESKDRFSTMAANLIQGKAPVRRFAKCAIKPAPPSVRIVKAYW